MSNSPDTIVINLDDYDNLGKIKPENLVHRSVYNL